jgi:hypothetical protein
MSTNFHPKCLPVLIGSLPLYDHAEGVKLVFEYTPEIPLWVQLPAYKEEGMVAQFQPGFPGLKLEKDNPLLISQILVLMMISLDFTKIIWR